MYASIYDEEPLNYRFTSCRSTYPVVPSARSPAKREIRLAGNAGARGCEVLRCLPDSDGCMFRSPK